MGGETTHVLQHVFGTHQWELRRVSRHADKTLTTLTAVTLEAAIQRAEAWLDRHEHRPRGTRWAPSHNWTGRWALRP